MFAREHRIIARTNAKPGISGRGNQRSTTAVLAAAWSFGVVMWGQAAYAKAPAEAPVCVDVLIQRPAPPGQAAPKSEPREEAVRARTSLEAVSNLDPEGSRDPRVESGAHLPLGQTPEAYLKRLFEHFVTHERGFIAVTEGCSQRIVVDLYPLRVGWTAFARYSGSGREERVDQLLPTELSQFAERAVLALLHDTSINHTVDRNNVLWADSLKATQSIRGRGHVALGLGTRLRGGTFDTVTKDAASPEVGQTEPTLRVFSPMLMNVGYRGQFEEFGVEAMGELDLGTSLTAARRNPFGGHIDYGGSTGVVLHAVRYADARGLTSLYFGGGATFALHWFSAIRPEAERDSSSRSTLFSGGLDIDGVVGYEFMRASAVSFFLQAELNLPAYAVRSENGSGAINTWFPGVALKLGAAL
jgi:hypothetical protein